MSTTKSKYVVQREAFRHDKKRYKTGDEIEMDDDVARQHLDTGALTAKAPKDAPAAQSGKGK